MQRQRTRQRDLSEETPDHRVR